MANTTILYRGAEAVISVSQYMGMHVVTKQRISKSYRIQEIDTMLISSRTREEAKLITESRLHGVAVPLIYDVDLQGGVITMEYMKGKRIKDILNTIPESERKQVCHQIGVSIAQLHNQNIIHGDITTSNMILRNDKIYFIDFGLGCKNPEIEAKAVDLHVLMEALSSTHSQFPNCFEYVLEGYKTKYQGDVQEVINTIHEIVRRGRYRS